MKQSADLKRLLTSIDHKSYPAYKDVRGAYDFNTYILSIDHVQGDPFASPSKVSVQVRHTKAGFPAELFDTPWKKTALEDYLLRCFSREIGRLSFKAKVLEKRSDRHQPSWSGGSLPDRLRDRKKRDYSPF